MAIVHLGAKRVQGLKIDRVNDSLGADADGTNSGVTLIPITYHASFDGTNDYVSIVDSSSNLIQGRSTWSISGWFKRNGSTDKYLVSQWGKGSSPDNRVFHIGIDSNGKLLFRQRTDGGQGASFTSNNAIPDNTWTHFAIVWQPNGSNWQAQMYINGTADNSKTDFANDMRGGSIAEPVYLGKNGSDATAPSGGGDYFNGGLYQILFYSSALTSANVTTLYNSGTPVTSPSTTGLVAKYNLSSDTNDSQGSLNGTNNGATFPTDAKLGTACYSFDGTDDYVVLTDVGTNGIDTTGDLSIVGWINLNVTNANQAIISNDSNSSSAGINLYVHSSNQLRFGGGSAGTQVTGATGKFTAGTWYHVAVVKSGANCSLYVDGVQDGSTQTDWGTIDGQAQATIGAQYSGSAYGDDFNGKIDDLAIYKRALTTTEIGKLANNNANSASGFYGNDTARIGVSGGALNFNIKRDGTWDGAHIDLTGAIHSDNQTNTTTTDDETWTCRCKIRFSDLGSSGGWNSWWIVISKNYMNFTTQDAGYDSGIGINFKHDSTSKYSSCDVHGSGTAWENHSGTGDNTQNWTPAEDTDYYLEIKRTSDTTYSVNIRTGSHTGSSVGLMTGTCSADNKDFRYFKVMNKYPSTDGTARAVVGTINDVKFYDGTNSPSGTPTYSFGFVDGDAQLVSSLSDKSNLKANYTMDSTALASLKGSTDYTEVFASDLPTGWAEDYATGYQGNFRGNYDGSSTANALWVDFNDGTSYNIRGWIDVKTSKSIDVSDTTWTLRYTLNINTFSTGGQILMGMSTNSSKYNQSQRFLGVRMDGGVIRLLATNNSADEPSVGNTTSSAGYSSISTGTDYFVEIYRNSNTLGLRIRTGSHTGALVHDVTQTIAGTGAREHLAMDYIKFMNKNSGGSGEGIKAVFKDLKIYNDSATTTGCKNDFSATSALDGQTNLPVNTIFEQIDDTPKYYWKQADNTWALDYHTFVANAHKSTGDGLFCGGGGSLTNNTSLATNYVWATNSANLPNNLAYSAGGGYKSSFQACGGYIASGSSFESSTIWDGTAWATAVALDTQRKDTTTYGGSPSSAIIALGRNTAGTEQDSSSKWNGTAWSSAGAVGSSTAEHVGGDGSDTSMLITGGSRGTYCDKWNGSSWSATTATPQTMTSHNHAGKNADTAHVAGGDNAYAYDWDGTTWTSVTTITLGSDTSPRYVSGGGNKDHHWVMCGLDGGSAMNNCTLWNGSSWTAKGNMTETQYGGLGDGTIR